jgi:diacylglycerol kinase (ATP)
MNDIIQQTSPARPFQFTGRIRSFHYAIRGILRMVRCQHNAWIHAVATVAVLGAGLFLRLSRADWCWIILAISIVWTAEALNTAFEFLADAASPDFHPLVRDAKDVAAGAVLITAVASSVIGIIILWPYLEKLRS